MEISESSNFILFYNKIKIQVKTRYNKHPCRWEIQFLKHEFQRSCSTFLSRAQSRSVNRILRSSYTGGCQIGSSRVSTVQCTCIVMQRMSASLYSPVLQNTTGQGALARLTKPYQILSKELKIVISIRQNILI